MPLVAKIVGVDYGVDPHSTLDGDKQRSIDAVVVANFHPLALHNAARCHKHRLYRAIRRLVEHRVDALSHIVGLAPGVSAIATAQADHILVIVALAASVGHIARTTYNQHLVALSVGYDAGITKPHIHKVGRVGTFTLYYGKFLAPRCSVVATYAGFKVDATIWS